VAVVVVVDTVLVVVVDVELEVEVEVKVEVVVAVPVLAWSATTCATFRLAVTMAVGRGVKPVALTSLWPCELRMYSAKAPRAAALSCDVPLTGDVRKPDVGRAR